MRLTRRKATVFGGVAGVLVAMLLGAGGGAVAAASSSVPPVVGSGSDDDDGPCGVTYGEHGQRPPWDCDEPDPEIPSA